MTVHDDEQDLVTIRIPRRAAALYAVELEVASSPSMVAASIYGGLVASALVFLAGLTLAATGIYQVVVQNESFASTLLMMSAGAFSFAVFFFAISRQRLRAARRHGLL